MSDATAARRTGAERGDRAGAPERAGDGERTLRRREEEGPDGVWPGLRGFARALAGIPAFGKLLFRLLSDARVPLVDKAVFAFTIVYLFVPIDLVPDWLPVVGGVDDLLLVVFSVDRLLHRTDPEVLLEHWDDDPERLLSLCRLLDRATGALPGWARRVLRAG